MTIPPAKPPALQTPLRPTDLGLATNKQISLEPSKSPCSSPLTSLMSESESEESKPQRSEMKKSKRSENLEWYAFLHISSDMSEMRDYPVLGDQFKSAREFERACLMASWPRGHSMHIKSITQSAARTKRVFSCVTDIRRKEITIRSLGIMCHRFPRVVGSKYPSVFLHLNHQNSK
ncbi:hypothetical protein CROQUDRAFT_144865 [Cronartium quercuum f. sp. fusiforme G11]|uniref:Uncharacterized protein n=1 Tax=Cronartium quercuum f. sp. fusiforme G11 TaxID=708437 RepID=A0A9P6NY30_9BASI|nr:hypothetical protein CROQUDRAFT_144865 [Cronartium quercuum f. sp. fusiforme G11]